MEESEIQKYIDFIQFHLPLDYTEQEIIRGTLQGQKYTEIMSTIHLSGKNRIGDSALRDIGRKLWKKLSDIFGYDIDKSNFLEKIRQIYQEHQNSASSETLIYVKREPIETDACLANSQPGSLIRIKAPQKMGKTLLLGHILKDAKNRGFKTVICDFSLFDSSTYDSYALLLQRMCSNVIRRLKLQLNEDKTRKLKLTDINDNDRAIEFFEDHILSRITGNLVLALENFDNVFERDNISENFCRLFLSCYDAPRRETDSLLSRLHLIIIHSTDVYGQMDINVSPLAGVGRYFELQMFNEAQIQDLFQQHKLSLNDAEKTQIIELLGGHPYLLTLAIRELQKSNVTLQQFLEEAPTNSGIFRDHLRTLLDTLNQDDELKEAYIKVVNSNSEVELSDSNRALSFQLYSLGLIKQNGDRVSPSCNLYKIYFQKHLNLD